MRHVQQLSVTRCAYDDEFEVTQKEIVFETMHTLEIRDGTSREEACAISFDMIWTSPTRGSLRHRFVLG
jgi:hypothetical protein